ncbi:MAG: EamA family transporter [Armatimonadia bacterium]
MTGERLRPYYFIAAGVILQGLSPVLTKLLLNASLAPATIVAVRYLIAVLVLLPFGWRHRNPTEHLPPRQRDWVALFLVGALGSGIASLLFAQAIFLTSAGVATALSKTAPIFVAFFAYFTLRERVTASRLALVGLMVAADVLIGAGEMSVGPRAMSLRLTGDGLALGAGMLRAFAEILSKASLRRFYPSTVAMWRFGVGFLVTGVIALGGKDLHAVLRLSLENWGIMLALGLLCTSLSMSLYYRGLRDIPAHVGVTLRLLSAVVTVGASWLWIGEKLNGLHLAGIAVLMAGAYLIVVRTTRQPALSPALEAVRPPQPWSPTRTLKGRVALMVALMIAFSVSATTVLSVRHATQVLRHQIQNNGAMLASNILQLQALGADQSLFRQYLHRLMNLRITTSGEAQTEGPGQHPLGIMYLIVQGKYDEVQASAIDPDFIVTDRDGNVLPPRGMPAARRILEMEQDGELRRHDVYPLVAPLIGEDGKIGTVRMGSKRSVIWHDVRAITLRNLSLAVLLITLGVFVSYYLTDYLARPLERLSSMVRRISNGELNVPVVALGGTEIESLGASVARMAEELRQGQMLRQSLSRCICPSGDTDEPLGAVCLLARLGGSTRKAQVTQFDALLEAVARNEGSVGGFAPGYVLATFGGAEPEQDDVLRAVVAALEWRAVWRDEPDRAQPPAALIGLREEPVAGGVRLEEMAAQLLAAPETDGMPIYLSADAAAAVAVHLDTQSLEGSTLRLVTEPEGELAAEDLGET